MEKKKQTAYQNGEIKYPDKIPKEILAEMTPEIRRQYFLWDEILKRQIELYPMLLFPLVKEIFGKEYPDGTGIRMLSTEYVVDKLYEHGEKLIESIRSDLLIQVGNSDLYHMECQMKKGGDIAVRMLEYDMNIALVHGLEYTGIDGKNHVHKYSVKFPQSAILYLDNAKKAPGMESCVMTFPDGTEYEYHVPVLNVQGYAPEAAGEKGLVLLFPFFPIRFRNRFEAILKKKDVPEKLAEACEEMETLKKDLTKFIADCIIIINRAEENGTMSNRVCADTVELMGKACDYLFKKEPELLREVHETMEPAIKLLSEEFEEQLAEKDMQLEQKDIQLEQKEIQLEQKDALLEQQKVHQEQHILNYIRQCREEGKSKAQTEHTLQKIFSLDASEAKEKLEKWW